MEAQALGGFGGWSFNSCRRTRTMESNLQAGSDGCAPTPSQYFARTESSLISLNGLPSPSGGGFGIGSYVPAGPSNQSLCWRR